MVCQSCGKVLEEGTRFCDGCGMPVSQPEPQYQQSKPVQQYQQAQPMQPYQQQYQPVQPQMQGGNVYIQAVQAPPAGQLNPNYSLVKLIFLGLITCGIYNLVVFSSMSERINLIASRYDGKKTMHYCLLFFLVGWLTLGIGWLVWYTNISSRIGNELARRGLPYSFGGGTFWGWGILGSLIVVGPFVYQHKLCRAMNLLCMDFNSRG